MTLLFFYRQQPYPPHPYEEDAPLKKKRKRYKGKPQKRTIEERLEAVPIPPPPETLAQVAGDLGKRFETVIRNQGPDWEKILNQAYKEAERLRRFRDEKELLEILSLAEAELEL